MRTHKHEHFFMLELTTNVGFAWHFQAKLEVTYSVKVFSTSPQKHFFQCVCEEQRTMCTIGHQVCLTQHPSLHRSNGRASKTMRSHPVSLHKPAVSRLCLFYPRKIHLCFKWSLRLSFFFLPYNTKGLFLTSSPPWICNKKNLVTQQSKTSLWRIWTEKNSQDRR